VILGNVRLAAESARDDQEQAAILADAIKAAESATTLTRQLLAYAGRTATEVRLVDLSEHVGSISDLLTQARPKKVRLELDLSRDLPVVMADTAQLQQVTMNLVLNAADAIGDSEGLVRVSTGVATVGPERIDCWLGSDSAMPGEFVTLQVSDTGGGMGEETQAAIFDPFFSTKTTGHGLGLSAVLGMVKGHGGGIDVESKPGSGTTFTVYLPAAVRGTIKADLPTLTPASQGRGRVLVVDDEEGMRCYLRRLLERAGYAVLEAGDGVEALEVVDSESPDIVVLDLNMPRMGGEEVLARLGRSHAALPVVLSSGDDASELASRVASMPRVRFVGKPYTEDKMLGTIERLLH
jgi:CheY-like chemotaxis protein/two-component sensor histidine kinase